MLLVVQTSGLEAALGHRLTSDGWWCSIDLRVVENLPQINESCDGEQTPPFTSPHVNKAALSTRCTRLYLRNVKSKCVRRMFNGTHTHTHQRTLHAVIQVLVDVCFFNFDGTFMWRLSSCHVWICRDYVHTLTIKTITHIHARCCQFL